MSDVFIRGHEWGDADGAASYPSFQPSTRSGKRKRDTLRCKIGNLSDMAKYDGPGEKYDGAGEGKKQGPAKTSKKKKKNNKELEREPSGVVTLGKEKSETEGILVDKLASKKQAGKRGKRVRFDLGEEIEVEPSKITLLPEGKGDLMESDDVPGLEIVDDLVVEPEAVDFVKPDRKLSKKSGKKPKGNVGKRLVEMVMDTGEESEELEEIFDSEEEFVREPEQREETPPKKAKKQKKEKKKERQKKEKKGLGGIEGSEPVIIEFDDALKSNAVAEGSRKGKASGKQLIEKGEKTAKKSAISETKANEPPHLADSKRSKGGDRMEEEVKTSGRASDNSNLVEERGNRLGLAPGKSIFDVREEVSPMEASHNPKKGSRMSKLLTKFHDRLLSGHFRYLNEKLYNGTGEENFAMMHKDRSLFEQYHRDYTQQMKSWPQLPVDVAIDWLQKKPEEWKVADFGCGEALLQRAVSQEVSSLDLVALVPEVIECNMAKTPLESASHDCAVFCLALMGQDYPSYLKEAARILKPDGVLWIAEVCSRFVSKEGTEEYEAFNSAMKAIGFTSTRQYWPNKVFVIMIFKKDGAVKKGKQSWPKLKNCAYKKR
ncbi:hypothetical protein BSKO_09835 [Bryopsis sp. KO-2023]|nr:hypothetical protein BSKO_09835 [Bryopsis sp. KO-2023]